MILQKPTLYVNGRSSAPTGWIRPEAVEMLLGCLLGKDVSARKPSVRRPVASDTLISAVYRDDNGHAQAVLSFDIELAANAAAALTLIRPGAATEAVVAKALPDILTDNLREILNVCAQLINESSTQHVVLGEVCVGPRLPQDALNVQNRRSIEFDVAVRGYNGGRLFLHSLDQE